MTVHTETHQPDTDLTLRDPSQSPLTIHALILTLTKQDDTPIEARLTFQVTPEIYQRIDTESLFNLKPDLRGSLTAGEFTSESNIEIAASLKPDLLTYVTALLTYLKNPNEQQPESPILSTESWLALQVKQHETGYRTFWDYLSPEATIADSIDSEKVNDAIVNFFSDRVQENIESMSSDAVSEALLSATKEFEEWIDTNLSNINEESIAVAIESVGKAFDSIAASSSSESERDILPAIIDFFTSDDWQFVKIQGEPALRLMFGGQNGKWTCLAKARTDRAQFVFYSICPVSVPESKRLALAEFIARANYGTIIGNFELDFVTGEIRYKTSIDISGSSLAYSQIKQLVYANVMMVDEYLPGIRAVIDNSTEPKNAIASIESPPATLSDDTPPDNAFPRTTLLNEAPPDNTFPPTTLSKETPPDNAFPPTTLLNTAVSDSESLLENPPPNDASSQLANLKNTSSNTLRLAESPKVTPSNNSLTTPLNPETPVRKLDELPTNTPPEKPKSISETLSLLTKEEIANFDKVRQMLREKQLLVAQTLLNKLKKQLAARLDAGSTVFADSKNFFEQNKTPVTTANLIRRYWNLFAQSKQLIEQGKNNETPIEHTITPILLVVREIAARIETKMTQLATSYTDAKLEIECLIEIAQLTEQLTYCREQLKNRT
jgi:hypothetical protein